MILAHIEVPGSIPWVDEFFGHPHEYWPLYLFISGFVTVTLVLYYYVGKMQTDINYLMAREESLTEMADSLFEYSLETNKLN